MTKTTLLTVEAALKVSSFKVEFNEMIGAVQFGREFITPSHIASMRMYLSKSHSMEASRDQIETALACTELWPSFNPIEDIAKKHKGGAYKGTIKKYAQRVSTYFGTKNEQDFRPEAWPELFLKYYVGMIAGGLPWCILPNEIFLIIVGLQGGGKTWWAEHMLPLILKKYISSYTIRGEINDKEVLIKMKESLLILDNEGAYMEDKSTAAMKDILSSSIVMDRTLYTERISRRNRVASFMMTSNLKDHQRDETGNRRQFVIDSDTENETPIYSIWNPTKEQQAGEELDRELMISEAYYLLKKGFNYQLEKEEVTFYNTQMLDNKVVEIEQSFVETYIKKEVDILDRKIVTLLDMENFAKDHIKASYSRKRLKAALVYSGIELKQYRTGTINERVYGFAISSTSLILDVTRQNELFADKFNEIVDKSSPNLDRFVSPHLTNGE